MRVLYNGVDLMPLTTHEFNITPVYDDSQTDYLYSRVTYLGEAIVNGDAILTGGGAPGPNISYDTNGAGDTLASIGNTTTPPGVRDPAFLTPTVGAFPYPARGINVGNPFTEPLRLIRTPNAPPLTHTVIRQRLSQPQGQLYIFSGPGTEVGSPPVGENFPPSGTLVDILIASPLTGRLVDCNNGPKPHLFNVIGDHGDGHTYVVIWGVETFINEASENGISPVTALLSNRFKQVHNIDDEGFTTVVTEGMALFRTDLMYNASSIQSGQLGSINFSPDAIRASMFLPVPLGFTRRIDYVEGLDSAVGIKYGYSDIQVKSNFVAGSFVNAAKISAVHRQAVVTNSDILGGVLDVYERNLGRKANKNFATPEAKTPPAANPGGKGAGRLRTPGRPVTPTPPKTS